LAGAFFTAFVAVDLAGAFLATVFAAFLGGDFATLAVPFFAEARGAAAFLASALVGVDLVVLAAFDARAGADARAVFAAIVAVGAAGIVGGAS
jgi:hypothetical protein